MGTHFSLLLLISITLSNRIFGRASAVTSTKQRCLDGSMWKRECNDCYCENGIPFCHALPCHLPRGVVRTPCQSGSTWKVNCNLCVCKTGIPVCSSLVCPSTSNGVIRNERCIETKMWKNGCNDCFCYFGLVACSVKPCNSADRELQSRERVGMWKPTLMFEIGESQNTQCIAGTSWKHKCNYCFCSYGIPACTMRDCSLEEAVTTSVSVLKKSPSFTPSSKDNKLSTQTSKYPEAFSGKILTQLSTMKTPKEPSSYTVKEILSYSSSKLETTELSKTSEALTTSSNFQASATTSERIESFSKTASTSQEDTTIRQ